MARKRKATSSQQQPPEQQKPKIEPVQTPEEDDEEEEEVEEDAEEEESESGSEEESGSGSESDEEVDSSSSEDDEPDDEDSKREALRGLLEPFGKPQIIDLLKEAAVNDPKLLAKIVEVADSDPANRKIFIHGLGWDATSEQLLQAFKPFGEIEDSKLITDKTTGRAKGYAFVVFKTRSAAKKALKVSQKKIGSRVVSCQLAALGHVAGGPVAEGGSRKLYVGNVGPHVDPERLKAFFRTFGEIEDGPIGLDQVSGRFKGFAVITFKSPEGFNNAVQEPVKVFENVQLHCKKFTENPNKEKNVTGQSGGGVSDVGYGNLGGNVNAGGLMMGQNPALGFGGNPMLAAGYNPAGMAYAGLSNPIGGMSGNYGMNSGPIGGMSGNYGMNSVNPSGVMGNYGSQAALQGLGPFQNVQTGQSSMGTVATATTATRAPASRVSSATTYPSYFIR